MTTHFLEEADALADRIAVLSSGQLRCVGSPMFLKRTLGGGYRLGIELKAEMLTSAETNDNVRRRLNELDEFVHREISNAQNWTQTLRNELIYTLPTGETQSAIEIASLMDKLEENSERFGIESLALMASSIEDVFVAAGIAKEFDENQGGTDKTLTEHSQFNPAFDNSNANVDITDEADQHQRQDFMMVSDRYHGLQLWFIQLYALCMKHIICIMRSPIVLLSQLIVPLVFASLAVWVIKSIPTFTDTPPLVLSPSHFERPYVSTFADGVANTSSYISSYEKTLNNQYPSTIYNYVDNHKYDNLTMYLEQKGKDNLPDYRTLYDLGATFKENSVVSYFNGDSYHSVAIALQTVFLGIFSLIFIFKSIKFFYRYNQFCVQCR